MLSRLYAVLCLGAAPLEPMTLARCRFHCFVAPKLAVLPLWDKLGVPAQPITARLQND